MKKTNDSSSGGCGLQSRFSDTEQVQKLLWAQESALQLFAAIESSALIRPGRAESEISDDICELATRLFNVTRHWHKRIVRAGRNTLATNSCSRRRRIDHRRDRRSQAA